MNCLRIKIIVLLALFFVSCQLSGQWVKQPKGYDITKFKKDIPKLLSATNAGTEFWCTFHPNLENTNLVSGVFIYVASAVKTVVTLEVPGKLNKIQVQTIPYDIISFDLGPSIAQPYRKADSQAPKKDSIYKGAGIHIYADQPIIVYGLSNYGYSSDSFIALPVSSLGKDYIVASWTDVGDNGQTMGEYLTSYTECVAAYDNTTVNFTLGGTLATRTVSGQTPGQTTTWTLSKGDVLMFGSLGYFADLTGSRWSASKPIACFSGSYSASIPENNQFGFGCGYTIEGELPTKTWGKIYLYSPIAMKTSNSIIRIFAKEDNTTIYRDSLKLAFIKYGGGGIKGDAWLSMRADNGSPRPIVFSGDKPISITQYNADDNPFQMAITPLEQFQNDYIFCTPGTISHREFSYNWINIIYKIRKNGNQPYNIQYAQIIGNECKWKDIDSISPDPGQIFNPLPNGDIYSSKQFLLPGEGVYKIKTNDASCIYTYESYITDGAYGHPASVGLKDLEHIDTLQPDPQFKILCDGTVLGKDGIHDAVVIDLPNDSNRSNLYSIIFNTNESFNYQFSYKDFVPGEDSMTTWKAWVVDTTIDAKAVIDFIDKNGNDTTLLIYYYATTFEIIPNILDYGLLIAGDTLIKDLNIINETTSNTISINSAFLSLKNQGFELLSQNLSTIKLPITLASNDTIHFKIRFTNNKIGKYTDTITVIVNCNKYHISTLESEVNDKIIVASDKTFNDTYVGNDTTCSINILNNGKFKLTIKGYQKPDSSIFKSQLPEINSDNPLFIAPNGYYKFYVVFSPKEEKDYLDSIVFFSDAKQSDSVCIIKGKGINKPINGISEKILIGNNLVIFPNPASNELKISYNLNANKNVSISITDILGNEVYSATEQGLTGTNNSKIDISTFPQGVYYLKLIAGADAMTRIIEVIR